MKIGPVQATTPMLIYAGCIAAGGIFLLQMWSKNKEVRDEAMSRETILQAMRQDSPELAENAIKACQSLVESNPERLNARMFMADLHHKQKQYAQARKMYEEAAGLSAITSQEKAWALVGAGVCVMAAASKDNQASAAAEAEAFFKKALAADPKCADAVINLGLAAFFKGGPDAAVEAEKFCVKAREMSSVGSLKAMEQLYMLTGILAAKLGKPAESVTAFEQLKAIKPSWKGAEDSRRMSMLASVVQKDMDPKERKDMLLALEPLVSKLAKDQQATALNAIGLGWWRFRGLTEYASGPSVSAYKAFLKATEADTKDPRGYLNLAGLLEEQALDAASKMTVPITGITGDTPPGNRWRDPEKKPRFPPAERALLLETRKMFKDQEDLLKKFVEKSAASPAEKMMAKIRQIACIRRQAYTLEIDEENLRAGFLNKAALIAKELLAAFPENPEVHLMHGYLLLDKDEYLNAYNAFALAQTQGMKSPELERMIGLLGAKPAIEDIRPREDRRWYGSKPLIAAVLNSRMSAGGLKKVSMKVGQNEIPADKIAVHGSQVLYLPSDDDLQDGQTFVTITATDALNQTVEFPPYSFSVDRQPPSWSVTPDGKTPVPNKPVFAITLSDRAGIDYSTLRVSLKHVDSQRPIPPKDLIKEGRIKLSMMDLTPVRKAGHPIDSDNFSVSAGGNEITPGTYELSITVSDLIGNELSDKKTYTLK